MTKNRFRPRVVMAGLCAFLAMVLGCQGVGSAWASSTAPVSWLRTRGNHIVTAEGKIWVGRGANIHDTRSCNACTSSAPDVAEVKRRIDALVDDWHADFLRLVLERYPAAEGRAHWRGILEDPGYLQDIVSIVRHIKTKPGVMVLVALWSEPSFSPMGWPSAATIATWRRLATALRDEGHVMFGIANEPQANADGALDQQVWTAMNAAALAIRRVEAEHGARQHIIAVQGTRSWGRRLDYYVDHPITAGGGANIVYETHVYDPVSSFPALFAKPAATLPVIIGEFGPASGHMTEADCAALMTQAESLGIPYLAWTFHPRCPPSLLVDNTGGGCGVGMPLQPTSWGSLLRSRLTGAPALGEPRAGGYAPKLTMGPNCNEWWVEVYADVASIELLLPNGTRVDLPKTDWGSFAKSVNVPAGTMIRLVATASDGRRATTNPFPFLRAQPTIAP